MNTTTAAHIDRRDGNVGIYIGKNSLDACILELDVYLQFAKYWAHAFSQSFLRLLLFFHQLNSARSLIKSLVLPNSAYSGSL
jgi:hypothetical protein